MNLPKIKKWEEGSKSDSGGGSKSDSPAKRAGFETIPQVTSTLPPAQAVQQNEKATSLGLKSDGSFSPSTEALPTGGQSGMAKFAQSGAMSAISNVGGAALQGLGEAIGGPAAADTAVDGQKALSAAAKQMGPWGQIAGLAMDATMALESALGVTQNTIDDDQAKRAGVGGAAQTLNNLTANVPGLGLIAAITSGKTDTAQKGEDVEKVRNAYSGSLADLDSAQSMSGKNYLFGTKKMNEFIAEMNRKNQILQEISSTNTLRKQSQYGDDLAQQNLNRYSGQTFSDMRVGKEGLRFPSKEEVQKILAQIPKFQDGGKMNVIPDGSLHAHKHHLNEVDERFEDLTTKGIPVVVEQEGGELKQIAEIEKEEIILHKDLTTQLEELAKDGSDEAAIQAGKILVEEILFNTDDRVGLLQKED